MFLPLFSLYMYGNYICGMFINVSRLAAKILITEIRRISRRELSLWWLMLNKTSDKLGLTEWTHTGGI